MKIHLLFSLVLLGFACVNSSSEEVPQPAEVRDTITDIVVVPKPDTIPIPIANGFDYPVGKKTEVTAKRDGDGWYNAQDFGENTHLGEDWNAESGGNTDCGEPVYAAADGVVIRSKNIGWGWGNVMIIRHKLPDGQLIETLYGHLDTLLKAKGDLVERRELIGKIGDGAPPCGDGQSYYAHLHFEMRMQDCNQWGCAGPGYGKGDGWRVPSDFIDAHR